MDVKSRLWAKLKRFTLISIPRLHFSILTNFISDKIYCERMGWNLVTQLAAPPPQESHFRSLPWRLEVHAPNDIMRTICTACMCMIWWWMDKSFCEFVSDTQTVKAGLAVMTTSEKYNHVTKKRFSPLLRIKTTSASDAVDSDQIRGSNALRVRSLSRCTTTTL